MGNEVMPWLDKAIELELERIDLNNVDQRREIFTDIVKVCIEYAKKHGSNGNVPEFEKYIQTGKRFVLGTGSYPLLHDLMATESHHQPDKSKYVKVILEMMEGVETLCDRIENDPLTPGKSRELLGRAFGLLDRANAYAFSARMPIKNTSLPMEKSLLNAYFAKN